MDENRVGRGEGGLDTRSKFSCLRWQDVFVPVRFQNRMIKKNAADSRYREGGVRVLLHLRTVALGPRQ